MTLYVVSVLFALVINTVNPNNALAANGSWTQPGTTAFAGNGTYSKTQESSATVKVGGYEGLSSNGGSGWKYRKSININNTSGGILTDYQVPIDSEANVAADWHFDETSGNASDSSPNSLTATNNGTITYSASGRTINGNANNYNAANMDSTTKYFTVTNTPAIQLTSDLTLEAWIYPTDSSWTRTGILGKRDGYDSTAGYSLDIYGNQIRFILGNGSSAVTAYSAANAFSINNWYHVVAKISGTTMQTYINGAPSGSSVTFAGTRQNPAVNLFLGRFYDVGSSYTFQGKLDDIRLYNKALSDSEISLRYANDDFSKFKSDGSDVRFTAADGTTELPYWHESFSNTVNGVKKYRTWTKVPSLATGNNTIYMYYGNSSAIFGGSYANSGANTFLAYSDVNDYASWTGGGVTQSSGELNISKTGVTTATKPVNFTGDWVVETKFKRNSSTYPNMYLIIGDGAGSTYATNRNVQIFVDYGSTTWSSYANGTTTTIYGSAAVGTYYISKEVRHGSQYDHYLQNANRVSLGSSLNTAFGVNSPADIITGIQYGSGSGSWNLNMNVAWLFAHKYASVEPTVSSGVESAVYYTGTDANYISPTIAPAAVYGNWGILSFTKNTPTNTTLTVDILDGATNATILSNVSSGADLGALGITVGTSPSLKLKANLATTDFSVTPTLNSWSVAYSYDTDAPTVPANFIANPLSSASISLSWNVSSDSGSGLAGYDVDRAPNNGGVPGTWVDAGGNCSGITVNNSCTDSGLVANTKYFYRVRAKDNVGNYSAYSGGTSGNIAIQPKTAATGKDTHLFKGSPATNYGTATSFWVGELNDGADRVTRELIQFDLAGNIPAGKQITTAVLSTYLLTDKSDSSAVYGIYRQKRAWSESGASWNNYDTSLAWQLAGGFGLEDSEQTSIGSRTFTSTETLGWKDFNLDANAIQEMYQGSFVNNGFLIKSETELDDAYLFTSSDNLDNNAPKLTVSYNDYVSTTTLANTPSLSAPAASQNTLKPSFSGTGATAGSIVRLYDNGTWKASTTAELDGTFVFNETTPGYQDFTVGSHSNVTVRGYNDSGETANSNVATVLIDVESPGALQSTDITQSKLGSTTGSDIADNAWGNGGTLYFNWNDAIDAPVFPGVSSGINQYHLYISSDPDAVPVSSGGNVVSAISESDVTIPSPQSGSSYYLRVQSEDNAGNISTPATLFTYRFDSTSPAAIPYIVPSPTGWSATNDFSFTWQGVTDTMSGMDKYYYRRKTAADTDTWETWDVSRSLIAVSGDNVLSHIQALYTGINILQVKGIDKAGNESAAVSVNYYYSGNIPAPVNLSVNLSESQNQTVNRYSFSWDNPSGVTPQGFYYSVNAEPDTQNSTFIPYGGSGSTTTGFAAFATKVGLNKFYVVTKANDNVGWSQFAMKEFTCNTAAPGIPINVLITDSSNRDTERWQLTVNWDQPAETSSDFSGYSVERSTDGVNYQEIATTASQTTGYLDTNLLSSVTYSYRIKAKDNTGNKSAASTVVSRQPTGRYTEPPKLVEDPKVEPQATKTKVTFVTDRNADSFVQIGTTSNYGMTQGQLDSTSIHEVLLSGLTPGTFYHYRAMWRDIDGNIGYSKDLTFKTQDAPGISEVIVSNVGLYSAIVSWKTTTVSSSVVYYGKTNTYGSQVDDRSGSGTTTHVVKLEGLIDSTTYHFKISGVDVDNNPLVSDDYSFETLTFPRTSDLKITQKADEAMSTIIVTWTSNVPTDSVVNYSGRESSKAQLETKHSIIIGNLKDNTVYSVTVSGRDAYGNQAESSSVTYKTPFDSRPPVISGITTETSIVGYGSEAKAQVIVSWETDEPSTSQVAYGVGVSGSEYSQRTQEDAILTTSHVVVISGLKPSTSYHYQVVSKDNASNKAVSEDNSLLTEQASSSVLDIIINSLQTTIGWIFKSFN